MAQRSKSGVGRRRRRPRLLPPHRRRRPADGLRPRQPDPLRGLAAVPGADRRAGARPRPARAGASRSAPPRPLRLLDARPRRASSSASSTSSASATTRSSSTTGARSALIAAQRRPERVRRLVVINAVPLLPGYRWHWVARFLAHAACSASSPTLTTTRAGLRLLSRQARGDARADAGRVHRPGLGAAAAAAPGRRCCALYRSADPDAPRRRRRAASASSTARRWSLWGARRPLHPAALRPRLRRALPQRRAARARARRPLARGSTAPDAVDRVVGFLASRLRRSLTAPFTIARACARLVVQDQPLAAAGHRSTPAASSCSSSSPTTATRSSAGSPTRAAIVAFVNAHHVIDLERSLGHLLRAGLPAGADRPRPVADRLRQLHVPELALRDHDRLPRLALPVPQRALLLRPQHVHGRDGRSPWSATRSTRPRRRGSSRARASPTRSPRFTGVAQDSKTASLLVNQYAAVPSMHIAFSLMVAVPGGGALARTRSRGPCGRPIRCSSSSSSSPPATTSGSTPPPARPSPCARRGRRAASSPACARRPGRGRPSAGRRGDGLQRGSVRPSSADAHNRGRRPSGAATRATG